jgi:hypothetical protein
MANKAGALKSWANTDDRQSRTKPGRDAFLERFEREVDPEGVLPEKQRFERAKLLRRAHMLQLSRRSAQVRRDRKGGVQDEARDDDGCSVISVHYRDRAGARADGGERELSEGKLAKEHPEAG